ncbi:MAG: ABC transporter ATP-binding protein [Oscillospiraceae bacterium]|nr:ABC transporter ATP-binding protein [Oscillospiraceae bacterium]
MEGIEIRGLTKRYRDITAVDHLNLSVGAGECLALLGINGAGKTTTIKMLSCLVTPTEGDALLLGHSVTREPRQVKSQIAVSPQESAVAPNLTVLENLELIAGIYGADRTKARQHAEAKIREFSMEEIAKKRAGKLSGGWQRRLSIAMALIAEPKILFLDEPTLGLDVLARRELWTVIRGLQGRVTLILTTHYLEEATALCDRIAILNRGRLKALGTEAELLAATGAKNFEDAFAALATGEGAHI